MNAAWSWRRVGRNTLRILGRAYRERVTLREAARRSLTDDLRKQGLPEEQIEREVERLGVWE